MLRIALALVSVFSVVAMPSSAESQDRDAALRDLLERRGTAVSARQRADFIATVHTEFQTSQQVWFDRFTALATSDYELTLDPDRIGELTRPRDRQKWGDDAVVISVRETYRLVGYDREPDINELVVTFAKQDGWRVASLSALDDLGVFSDKQLWDTGPVSTRLSDHFLFFFHPEDEGSVDSLIRHAEASIADVELAWKADWHQKVVVYLPSSSAEVKVLLGATFDVSSFVAFAVASLDEEFRSVGNRVILNPPNFLRHSAAGRQRIFSHELLHVATRPHSGPAVPVWVEEGLAQLTEGGRVSISARGFDGRLPEDLEFISGGTQSIVAAYEEAHSAVLFMRDITSQEKVEEFYRVLGAARVEPGTSRYHTDRAMQQALGMSLTDFETRWTASVRS